MTQQGSNYELQGELWLISRLWRDEQVDVFLGLGETVAISVPEGKRTFWITSPFLD